MRAAGIFDHRGIIALEPLGYVDFLSLVRGSTLVLTDSGGVQEETTVLGIPCLTLRPNTERPATITYGTNRLATVENLVGLVTELLAATRPVKHQIPPLWDGKSGKRIAKVLDCFLSRERVNTAQH
jgi:UDP-N-acetylglucosamine 2-epimerase (non-hydrolysing)